MKNNPVIDVLLNRKSVRKFKDTKPDRETIETIVRSGMQAPFASQLYSVIYQTEGAIAFHAPLWFLICVDAHKLELFMKQREWDIVTNDLTLLLLGMQRTWLKIWSLPQKAWVWALVFLGKAVSTQNVFFTLRKGIICQNACFQWLSW
jgi:hypothetical protein